MPTRTPTDALTLGQHLVSVLDSGARVATYKLAVLVALLEYCVEHVPAEHDTSIDVDLTDLAERVIALYWRQVRDFEGVYLRQSSNRIARIPDAVRQLAAETRSFGRNLPLETAAAAAPELWEKTVDTVRMTMIQQPLHRLQKVPGASTHSTFLYDDSWMHDAVGRKRIAEVGNRITLYPGVAFGLARLSGLLKPGLLLAWVDDVRRMNPALSEGVPDLEGHLFGQDRIALQRPRQVLIDEYGDRCFYCGSRVGPAAHVDHVLPWSRVGLDGLANLVLACSRCNSSKSDLLPERTHVSRALDRDPDRLTSLAAAITWPVQYHRVVTAARGLYATQPDASPLWRAPGDVVPLTRDVTWLHSKVIFDG